MYGNLFEIRLSNENTSKAFTLRDRTSEKERFYITGHYYSDVTGELDKEIETYLLWTQTYPRDATAHNNLGRVYRQNGEREKELEENRRHCISTRTTPFTTEIPLQLTFV